ncbi:MAG: CinA family protein [Pseudomonadota bacterium]
MSLAVDALNAARGAGALLVTVESCTGGLVGAALTDVPGSSDAVFGGFITYANAAKIALGVAPGDLAAHGAVSETVALAMADAGRARAVAATNGPAASIAITGVAGPGGGTAQKPVGLVHFAFCGPDGTVLHRRELFGDVGRERVRAQSVEVALTIIIKGLRGG